MEVVFCGSSIPACLLGIYAVLITFGNQSIFYTRFHIKIETVSGEGVEQVTAPQPDILFRLAALRRKRRQCTALLFFISMFLCVWRSHNHWVKSLPSAQTSPPPFFLFRHNDLCYTVSEGAWRVRGGRRSSGGNPRRGVQAWWALYYIGKATGAYVGKINPAREYRGGLSL